MEVAAPPRPKTRSSAVTRRSGGQLISWYFNSISSTRLLTKEQEQELSHMIIAGDELSMEDLVQEGSLGLLKAVGRFNPERGQRFSTYATWWIRTTVQRAVADQARTIRLPFGKSRMLSKAKRVYDTLQQEKGRKPTEEELADELDVPV